MGFKNYNRNHANAPFDYFRRGDAVLDLNTTEGRCRALIWDGHYLPGIAEGGDLSAVAETTKFDVTAFYGRDKDGYRVVIPEDTQFDLATLPGAALDGTKNYVKVKVIFTESETRKCYYDGTKEYPSWITEEYELYVETTFDEDTDLILGRVWIEAGVTGCDNIQRSPNLRFPKQEFDTTKPTAPVIQEVKTHNFTACDTAGVYGLASGECSTALSPMLASARMRDTQCSYSFIVLDSDLPPDDPVTYVPLLPFLACFKYRVRVKAIDASLLRNESAWSNYKDFEGGYTGAAAPPDTPPTVTAIAGGVRISPPSLAAGTHMRIYASAIAEPAITEGNLIYQGSAAATRISVKAGTSMRFKAIYSNLEGTQSSVMDLGATAIPKHSMDDDIKDGTSYERVPVAKATLLGKMTQTGDEVGFDVSNMRKNAEEGAIGGKALQKPQVLSGTLLLADTTYPIAHNLGRVPDMVNILQIDFTGSGRVFEAQNATASYVYLRTDRADVPYKVYVS
ncbi:hypothetical protein ES703_04165 [subsurface metagenome]|nr:hypothetical protein [bacterium]